MGWAKYAEDNYDAFFERQALRGGLNDDLKTYPIPVAEEKPKEKSNFAEMFFGESCFSF